MPFIIGTPIPEDKILVQSVSQIYGIDLSQSKNLRILRFMLSSIFCGFLGCVAPLDCAVKINAVPLTFLPRGGSGTPVRCKGQTLKYYHAEQGNLAKFLRLLHTRL